VEGRVGEERSRQRARAAERARLDLNCWQVAFCSAEPIRAETLDRFAEAFAPAGFRAEAFYPCYGLAEATLLAAGGKVLALLDLTDVHMTIFLPTREAGRLALGSEARIVLDAAPNYVIPAKVSFVAAEAQFTPKYVETASEREKLMFRIKVQVPRDVLEKYEPLVKTGIPGVAYVKTALDAQWPERLAVKLP